MPTFPSPLLLLTLPKTSIYGRNCLMFYVKKVFDVIMEHLNLEKEVKGSETLA